MGRNYKNFFIVCLCLIILLLSFFEAKAEEKPSLVIMPFMIAGDGVCPICRTLFRKGEILPSAKNILTRILYQKIGARGIFKIIPLEKIEEVLSQKDKKQFEDRAKETFVEIGRELGSDFICGGFIFRFEERRGSSLGVERPASLAFDLHLFRIKDGVEFWKGRMDETQRPLSENILKIGSFLRRKGKWLTVEELASVGLEEVLWSFPGYEEFEVER